jgi:hypothetical protein
MSPAADQAVQMTLSVVDPHLDPEEVESALLALRRELSEHHHVVAARPVSRLPAPAGTRAVDGLVAALSVTVLNPTVLAVVMEALSSWITRRNRTIRVEIDGDVLELTGATPAQQQQVLDAWLRRRERPE